MEETISFSSSDCAAYLYLANAMRISALQVLLQLLGAAKNLAHLPSFKQANSDISEGLLQQLAYFLIFVTAVPICTGVFWE